jgi:diguanylate cyclase (GGDEF)-like protein
MGVSDFRHFDQDLRTLDVAQNAICDPLTGLYLREHWERLLQANFALTLSTGGTATLVAAELDHLHVIQERHGRTSVDQALRRFGHLLRTHLRATDIRGRRGADSFGILLPDTDVEGALRVVEHLHWMLDVRPLLAGERLSVSLGVCSMGPGMDGAQSWLQRADGLLQQARRSGGDCARASHQD